MALRHPRSWTLGNDRPAGGAVLLGFLDGTPEKAQFRQRAIEALGLLKFKDAVPVLLEVLEKRDRRSEEERKLAVIALGRIGDPSAVEPLLEAVRRRLLDRRRVLDQGRHRRGAAIHHRRTGNRGRERMEGLVRQARGSGQ